jgi:hypothetical protein
MLIDKVCLAIEPHEVAPLSWHGTIEKVSYVRQIKYNYHVQNLMTYPSFVTFLAVCKS